MLVISGLALKQLLARGARVSTNLSTWEADATYAGNQATVEGEHVDLASVKRVHDDRVYVAEDGKVKEASFFADKVYGLRALEGHAPTIEINGIRMHRMRPAPEEDAENKAKFLGVKAGERALDTCCGLGYSAGALFRAGCKVTTIEIDDNVLRLAELNPWSQPFFDAVKAGKIRLLNGSCAEKIKEFPNASFDVVLHDPPRVSVAKELYAQEFYEQVHRVLGEGGKFFHYTGKPLEKHGKGIRAGVQKRLRKAGFRGIEWNEECLGFKARK